MKIEEIIASIGLSHKEARIYVAALDIGEGTISDLAHAAGLNRATTHVLVEQMLRHGYLTSVRRNNHRFINPTHPRRLVQVAEFRKEEISKIFPSLVTRYNTSQPKSKIQVFEGHDGITSLYEEIYRSLKNNHELLGMTRIDAIQKIAPGSLEEYKKLLVRVKNPMIREIHYGINSAQNWYTEIKNLMGTKHHIRAIEHEMSFGFSDCIIYEDTLAVFSLTDETPFVIVIHDPQIVQTHRSLFEFIWQYGKKITEKSD